MTRTAAERDRLLRRGFQLEYASIAWMIAEAAVAITAGIRAWQASDRTRGRAAPVTPGGSPATTIALAGLSRELATNDWQDRTDARRGSIEDRNAALLVPAPFSPAGHTLSSAHRILVTS